MCCDPVSEARSAAKEADHDGRTIAEVCARIGQRILAPTHAIWHNGNLGLRIRRSLTAYDH